MTVTVAFVSGQNTTQPTSSFVIHGKVKGEKTVSLSDLRKLTLQNIGDVVITSHMGETRGTAKALKGVLLKDVLVSVQIILIISPNDFKTRRRRLKSLSAIEVKQAC